MYGPVLRAAVLLVVLPLFGSRDASAKDYFLTVGGGYSPRGNQASMEANVLFFEQVLAEKSAGVAEHRIYFADGSDASADVQETIPAPEASEAERFLAEMFDWEIERTIYRDHHIAGVDGRNHPRDIRRGLEQIIEHLAEGDRLFIYVTAHGSPADDDDPNAFNTEILGWDDRSFDMESFARWLDGVPSSVPVVMVMAQCYCGGFSHAIFRDGNAAEGLAEGLRCGFFAQQHDLPAAGCRPDISNDEEYSSYFWGAIMGRSRTGEPIEDADLDADGFISFAEAHAHAVLASPTIDIPLRTSDAFLRSHAQSDAMEIQGTLGELAARARPIDAAIVIGLAQQLEISLEDDATTVVDRMGVEEREMRRLRRGRSARREFARLMQTLRDEMLTQWPEFERLDSLEALCGSTLDRQSVYEQVQEWPSYRRYAEVLEAQRQRLEQSRAAELRSVKTKRLLQMLQTIVLAEALPRVADPSVVDRYERMVHLEGSRL